MPSTFVVSTAGATIIASILYQDCFGPGQNTQLSTKLHESAYVHGKHAAGAVARIHQRFWPRSNLVPSPHLSNISNAPNLRLSEAKHRERVDPVLVVKSLQ